MFNTFPSLRLLVLQTFGADVVTVRFAWSTASLRFLGTSPTFSSVSTSVSKCSYSLIANGLVSDRLLLLMGFVESAIVSDKV
jgi:hypothetical protein